MAPRSVGAFSNLTSSIEKYLIRDRRSKGVATFVADCPAGPSPVNVFLRAGWSLGAVTSRYILAGQGGDQVCYC